MAVLNPIATFTYPVHTLILGKNVTMAVDSPSTTGTAPYTPLRFYVSPALPDSLRLDSLTGKISGKPLTAQTSTPYVITVKNGVPAYDKLDTVFISVLNAPTSLTYSALTPVYGVNLPITDNTPTLTATAPFTPVTYSIDTSGIKPLPTGLAFSSSTGVISGTPTSASNFANYTITVSNAGGNAQRTINMAVLNPISTFTYPVHTLILGKNLTMAVDSPSTTGTAPFTPVRYSISPALPDSLRLDTLTGKISGKPLTAQDSTRYIVTATNIPFSKADTISIKVLNGPTSLTYSQQTAIYGIGVGVTNTPTLTATPPYAPVTYTVDSLPAGLTINGSTGVISGTPTTASSTRNYVVTAINLGGNVKDTLHFSVLAAPTGLNYATTSLLAWKNIAIANDSPTVTGTVQHYSVAPSLPSGLVLDTNTGVISGAGTAASAAANYVVTASNVAGSTTKTLNIRVKAAPSALSYSASPVTYGVGTAITNNVPTVTDTVTLYSATLPSGLSDRKSTRLNSSHMSESRMPSSA